MRRRRLVALILSSSSLAGCQTVWMEATEHLELGSEGVHELYCNSHDGRIELIGDSETDKITVSVRKVVGGVDARDAQAAMASLQIVGETSQGRLHLGYRWLAGSDRDWRVSVSFRVVYPRELETVVETRSGDIRIRGARRRCTATSRNGSIDVQGALAWTRIRTRNGRVRANLSTGGERKKFACDIMTSNGSVSLVLDRRASARLSCSTSQGVLDCDLPLRKFSINRLSIGGTLGSGLGSITIRTGSGGIRLRSRAATL